MEKELQELMEKNKWILCRMHFKHLVPHKGETIMECMQANWTEDDETRFNNWWVEESRKEYKKLTERIFGK